MRNIKRLMQFLQEIDAGEDSKRILRQNGAYLSRLDVIDLAFAEKSLFDNGMTIKQLYKVHQRYAVLIDHSLYSLWQTLAPNHLGRQAFVEHEVFRAIVYDLLDTALEMRKVGILSDISSEYRYMGSIIQRLLAAHDHSCYEEDILIPELTKFGLGKLEQVVQNDHKTISLAVDNLAKLFNNFAHMDLNDFKDEIHKSANYIFDAMMVHCFMEDNIILPMALDSLDARMWQRMKNLCNELGYCGMREVPIA